jgi:hypothetical protein
MDAKAPEEKPLTEEEKKKKAEEEAEKIKELQEIDIKTGDYQVLVHIIEARDLKVGSAVLSIDLTTRLSMTKNL